jgi:hypothetical protein
MLRFSCPELEDWQHRDKNFLPPSLPGHLGVFGERRKARSSPRLPAQELALSNAGVYDGLGLERSVRRSLDEAASGYGCPRSR